MPPLTAIPFGQFIGYRLLHVVDMRGLQPGHGPDAAGRRSQADLGRNGGLAAQHRCDVGE
jgi:hypothetical protein